MAVAKFTWIFTGPGRSWTESLFIDSAAWGTGIVGDSLKAGLDWVTGAGGITPKRTALLGNLYGCAVVRAGFPDINVRALLRYIYAPGDQNHGSNDAEVSLVTRCIDPTGRHLKYISMRGLWSNIEINSLGQIAGTNGAAFNTAYSAWSSLLISQGWMWRGVAATTPANIETITQLTNGRQRIEINPDIVGISGTNPVPVRISGVGGAKRLNGVQLVVRTGVKQLDTYFPFATFDYTTGGKVKYQTKTYYDINEVDPQRIGSRDVGNSFRLSVGRRKAVPKG